MSRYTHQIIEIKVNGQWQYVPVYKHTDDDHNALSHCGFLRDMFGGGLYGADKYLKHGVPNDITKTSREAMIYGDEDYVTCHPVWLTKTDYENLIEYLEQELEKSMEKLFSVREKSEILKRLDKLENKITGTVSGEEDTDECDDYYLDDYHDALWIYTCARENLAEIQTLANYQTDKIEDLRIIMFTI